LKKKVGLLIVDDSALVRQVLTQGLSADPEIEVVGTASDPYVARDKILQHHPDVLTLDVEMPRMDGVAFLRRLMPQHPLPVLMVSSLTEQGKKTTIEALEAGAVDFVAKPRASMASGLNTMLDELRSKVKMAATANVSHWKNTAYRPPAVARRPAVSLAETTDKVIAIGASTGGTEAIRHVLCALPADTPGIVIVQHMPPGFTTLFAQRLDEQCAMRVKEAATGDRILRGRVLVAPGNYHMRVVRSGGTYLVDCSQSNKVCGHRPSVEVLFNSVAGSAGANAVGVILTGMGADGASGLVNMRKAGAGTLAQDEATSVVFGMPKAAYESGGTSTLVPLQEIADRMRALLAEK